MSIQTQPSRLLSYAHGLTAQLTGLPVPVNITSATTVAAAGGSSFDCLAVVVSPTQLVLIFTDDEEWSITGIQALFGSAIGDKLYLSSTAGEVAATGTVPIWRITGPNTAVYLGLPVASTASPTLWQSLPNSGAITEGNYQVTPTSSPFPSTLALSLANGESVRIADPNNLLSPTGYVEIGTVADTFNGVAGPFLVDVGRADVTIIQSAANDYEVSTVGTMVIGDLLMAGEQSANFTAAKGYEYPIDVSANAPVSTLAVTAPAAPSIDDQFAVFDSRLSCDQDRVIQINFGAEPLHSLVAPGNYAVINSAGARILFTYAGAGIGWRVASNVNE